MADFDSCREACANVDYVLHQAGFVSVPRSLEDPRACHETNVTGTLNILLAAREAGVRRVVYASSSAVYGDDARLPKVETEVGHPLSPYGASKLMGEWYARLFAGQFKVASVGFRQDPSGGYAAVIPLWISQLLRREECVIYGDGAITRDFCPVADVVQANLLAATAEPSAGFPYVFNVGLGCSTTLERLHGMLAEAVSSLGVAKPLPVQLGLARPGDIQHSAADITAIRKALGFAPSESLACGLESTMRWYAKRFLQESNPKDTGA